MKKILEKDVKRCAQQLLYDYDKQAIEACEFPKVLLFCAEYMDSELVGEYKERLEYIAREILSELKFDIYVENFEENPKYNSIEQKKTILEAMKKLNAKGVKIPKFQAFMEEQCNKKCDY